MKPKQLLIPNFHSPNMITNMIRSQLMKHAVSRLLWKTGKLAHTISDAIKDAQMTQNTNWLSTGTTKIMQMWTNFQRMITVGHSVEMKITCKSVTTASLHSTPILC